MVKQLFFHISHNDEISIDQSIENEQKYTFVLWKPSLSSLAPKGIPMTPYVVWWLFHCLNFFYNHDYAIFLIYDEGHLIHRSCIFPGYFRFPFMQKQDLQIGDTWTDPAYRGRGLAVIAMTETIRKCAKQNRDFWYLVAEDNASSIRVAEKAGFKLFGRGVRTKRFGSRMLGAFAVDV